MARITFNDSSDGTHVHTSRSGHRGNGSGGKRRANGNRHAAHSTAKPAKTPHLTRHIAHPANIPATTRAPLPGGDHSPWSSGAHTPGSPSPALELTGGAGLFNVVLDLAGAEGGSVRSILAAWQHEQDRLANRAWRRPGGLVRPAGL